MAERNAIRTGKPQGAQPRDPFAELTLIIGFDPRVKILKPAAPAQLPEAEPAVPATQGILPPAAVTAQPIERGRAEEWETEFSDLDFGLAPIEASPPQSGPPERPHAAPSFAVGQDAPESADRRQQRIEDVEHRTLRDAAPSAGFGREVASFEVSSEVDEITDAFEREWNAKAAWTPTQQTAGIAEPLPLRAPPGPEAAPIHDEKAPDDAVDAFLDDKLDDVLAASIELDLDEDWLEDEQPDQEIANTALETASANDRAPLPVAQQSPAIAAAAPAAESRNAVSFEDELASLLSDRPRPSAVPSPSSVPPSLPAAVTATPVATPAEPAETASRQFGEARGTPEPMPALPANPDRAARENPAPKPAVAPPRNADPEDDPFAALAAMAARYRAAQFQPAPKAEPQKKPAVSAAPPVAVDVETASAKPMPEVEEMKRTSSVRYDTPDINTTDVPEHPMAMADDLDIPADPYGSYDEPRNARAAYGDYDSEFDDLLHEMSAGEPVDRRRPVSQASRAAMPAPQPRRAAQPAPRPVMPRASTIPAGTASVDRPRAPQAQQAYNNPARFDPDWDDYGAQAQAGPDYGYDDTALDDFESEQPAPRRPERKRAKWLAALFGSVVLVGGGAAYALKFTGAAELGGPVLVKADAGPLKVRPDNPGGTAVPNQENQVYERVAGVDDEAASQSKLLSSTEEPVSLDEPDDEASDEALPGVDLSGDDADAQAEGKGEDRIEASAGAPQPLEDKAPIAIAPRKVRTMAVRPDGTLAAREDASPAVQALASNVADGIDTVKKNSLTAEVDTATPTASVTPTTDDAPAVGPIAASAGDGVAAEPAVVAPDGQWAMQIASQPSEAAARSSYADLAKRYPGVLGGRSVNIVKADVSGKGTFWRVRVGAEDRSEAAALCTSYKAAGGNCFVTK